MGFSRLLTQPQVQKFPWLIPQHSITSKSVFDGTLWSLRGAWWRHQMEAFSALLAICAGNSPGPVEFPSRSSDAELWCFFDLRLNKRLSKQYLWYIPSVSNIHIYMWSFADVREHAHLCSTDEQAFWYRWFSIAGHKRVEACCVKALLDLFLYWTDIQFHITMKTVLCNQQARCWQLTQVKNILIVFFGDQIT